MPFKIVQSQERGRPRLTIVPSPWEANGKLRWPPKNKNALKFIKDETSTPGADWQTMDCILKRDNIATYHDADDELTIMEDNTDTDCHDDNTSLPTNSKQHRQQQSIDYDAMAENLAGSSKTPDVPSVLNENNNVPTLVDGQTAVYEVCNPDSFNQISENQSVISQKLDIVINLLEGQQKVTENIANKIAFMSVEIDDINEKLRNSNPVNVTMLKDVNPNENESFSFKIIENQKGLKDFEKKISNKVEYKKLKKTFEILCNPGSGKGVTCGYKLLDILLSRDFLCQCSWSGGSRGENSKVPIKNYKFFIKFFGELINGWDASFTVEDTEKFFKSALRNATKRKLMQNLRSSAKKSRKVKAKDCKGSEDTDDKTENETNNDESENNNNIENSDQNYLDTGNENDEDEEESLC